jgi:hypothetical protein
VELVADCEKLIVVVKQLGTNSTSVGENEIGQNQSCQVTEKDKLYILSGQYPHRIVFKKKEEEKSKVEKSSSGSKPKCSGKISDFFGGKPNVETGNLKRKHTDREKDGAGKRFKFDDVSNSTDKHNGSGKTTDISGGKSNVQTPKRKHSENGGGGDGEDGDGKKMKSDEESDSDDDEKHKAFVEEQFKLMKNMAEAKQVFFYLIIQLIILQTKGRRISPHCQTSGCMLFLSWVSKMYWRITRPMDGMIDRAQQVKGSKYCNINLYLEHMCEVSDSTIHFMDFLKLHLVSPLFVVTILYNQPTCLV